MLRREGEAPGGAQVGTGCRAEGFALRAGVLQGSGQNSEA